MHDNNIYYYKNVNKEQVKMWHIFQLYLADKDSLPIVGVRKSKPHIECVV